MTLEFSRLIFGGGGEAQISSFIKTRPLGAGFFNADGQMDMKLKVASRNFRKSA
jgi:hypothetical protein